MNESLRVNMRDSRIFRLLGVLLVVGAVIIANPACTRRRSGGPPATPTPGLVPPPTTPEGVIARQEGLNHLQWGTVEP